MNDFCDVTVIAILDSDMMQTTASSGACIRLDSSTSPSVVASVSNEIPDSIPYSPSVQQMTFASGTDTIAFDSPSS